MSVSTKRTWIGLALASSILLPTIATAATYSSLKASANGKFVSAESAGADFLVANRDAVGTWEQFQVLQNEDGSVSLLSAASGNYVSADLNRGARLIADRATVEAWEKFWLVPQANGTVALQAEANGLYVSADLNVDGVLVADRDTAQGWEQFTVTEVGAAPTNPGGDNLVWRTADLTNYTSYPAPGSDECLNYNGCLWAGTFAFVDGRQTEDWVRQHNIIAVHSKDAARYQLKTFRLRQGSRQIDATVYDMCSDSDCDGCCSQNCQQTGFLIDIEKYTMERFGSGEGIVEWACLDCE